MAYVRISISTPKQGGRTRALEIEDALLEYHKAQPGFQAAYKLVSPTRVGRLSIWDSEASADHAANSEHVLALRAELLTLLAETQELAFEGEPVT